MANIDRMLDMMNLRGIERALLISERPIQLYAGDRQFEGSLLAADQLRAAIEEIVPASFQAIFREGGACHFVYQSPHGAFDVGVESVEKSLHVTISPSLKKPNTYSGVELVAPHEPLALTPRQVIASPWSSTPNRDPNPANTPAPAPKPVSAWDSQRPPSPVAPAAPSSIHHFCATHHGVPAAGVCDYSRKFYCRDCLVEINGRVYGRENLSEMMGVAQQNPQGGAYYAHPTPPYAQGPQPPYMGQQVPPSAPQPPYMGQQQQQPASQPPYAGGQPYATAGQPQPPYAAPPVYGQAAGYGPPPSPVPQYPAHPASQYQAAPPVGSPMGYGGGISYQSPRSKIVGGLLGIFLGGLGIHRFYLGYGGVGTIFLVLSLVLAIPTCGYSALIAWTWGFIEGLVILCGGMNDAEGRPLSN